MEFLKSFLIVDEARIQNKNEDIESID